MSGGTRGWVRERQTHRQTTRQRQRVDLRKRERERVGEITSKRLTERGLTSENENDEAERSE